MANSWYLSLVFLCIFLAYFRLIWLFCRYTDEKWWLGRVRDNLEHFRLKLKLTGCKLVPICWGSQWLSALVLGSWRNGVGNIDFSEKMPFWPFWSPKSSFYKKRLSYHSKDKKHIGKKKHREKSQTPSSLGLERKEPYKP